MKYYIDAGVEHLHLLKYQKSDEKKILDITIKVDDAIEAVLQKNNLWTDLKQDGADINLFVTGKLSAVVVKTLGFGWEFMPAAVFWAAAKFLLNNRSEQILGIIDLSASGYMAISVNRDGELVDDNLVVNPRCGAGSGTNLSRILQKLDIEWSEVDTVLGEYLGDDKKEARLQISVRADRCGVFSSSATISDKNQGIPLQNALAVTLKSEVYKAVKKVSAKCEVVYLSGRVFNWQFARDCARDYLTSVGVKEVLFDDNQEISLLGLRSLVKTIGLKNIKPQISKKLARESALVEYPGFGKLLADYSGAGLYVRDKEPDLAFSVDGLKNVPVVIGLDVGSTMAKIVIANALTHELLYLDSFNNHGDTIETIKYIFKVLFDQGVKDLNIQQIGITGSGRYQIQKVLRETYPYLRERIEVLVENYAHARGSLQEVKDYIAKIKSRNELVNEDFCMLVDVGGEDTKISVISLKNEDLYDNAMNIKCSAGTGSLIDTLRSMFGVESVKVACDRAMLAKKSYGINATCAVFLIENARKLQAQGVDQYEILASCYWAIVENMSRTLWSQVDFPKNTVTLLHGQTMLSDPLPLAVTHRLQEYSGSRTYAYVPRYPGHRACFGLIKGLEKKEMLTEKCDLSLFIDREFAKKIFICRGAACGDKNASCSRSMLSYTDQGGVKKFIALGGCTSVNEKEASILQGVKKDVGKRQDAYRDIWQMFNDELPRADVENRLVIPRSFAVSEQAFFLAKIFSYFGIPVFVDNVQTSDILEAQPRISIDTCAPVIGAVGQFSRLARESRGVVLVPQIDFLPTGKKSLGRTCTTNQGGVVIAMNMAKEINPAVKFFLTDISLHEKSPKKLARRLLEKLKEVLLFYKITPEVFAMEKAISVALEAEKKLRSEMCELAAEKIKMAIAFDKQIVIVSGREYILNPGIYDSHIGRLFSDNGAVAIPSYIFNGELESEFSAIYWRNPHHLLSIVRAVQENRVSQLTNNKKLAGVLREIEEADSRLIGVIFVSTFRCGPDSMVLQTAQEIAKNIPFLIIQSDAAINELAHLENRVNTYLNQLRAESDNRERKNKNNFKIEFLDKFTASKLDKKEDVLYFPTMEDNRTLTAVMRSAGYNCIDNYKDGEYDLQKIIKFGRRFAGDTVCAPFAAVLADTMLAVADFVDRKKRGEFKDAKKVVVFNNKGTGPCRQGQYYEAHRLLLHRELRAYLKTVLEKDKDFGEITVQYIVGHEKNNYNIGLESWALAQSFQALVMQGVLHGIFLESGKVCNSFADYEKYTADFLLLKQEVFNIFENINPGPVNEYLLKIFSKIPFLNLLSLYSFTGLINNNGLRKVLGEFAEKWNLSKSSRRDLKIYAEGEAYMRVAQIEEVYKNLLDDLGVGSFEFAYSPVWLYFEYILENKLLTSQEEGSHKGILKKYFAILKNRLMVILFRKIFVSPLYYASKLHEPELMSVVLKRARQILPTNKPYGELAPYVGEALIKLNNDTELFLNIAPEGCMVATMGDMLTKAIYDSSNNKKKNARIQGLFSSDGEVDNAKLIVVLLKILGPERYYSNKK